MGRTDNPTRDVHTRSHCPPHTHCDPSASVCEPYAVEAVGCREQRTPRQLGSILIGGSNGCKGQEEESRNREDRDLRQAEAEKEDLAREVIAARIAAVSGSTRTAWRSMR